MRIALLYNQPSPSKYHALGEGAAVSGVMDSVEAIKEALITAGHQVSTHGLLPPLSDALNEVKQLETELVFNLFEGFDGQPETEWKLARGLETLGCRFTGASSGILARCQDKALTKGVLVSRGIPTPDYQLLRSVDLESFSLDLPVIVKPAREDASHGLSCRSVAYDRETVRDQVASVERLYGGPVLVESFIPGREFNVTVLGGPKPRTLPATEIAYAPDMPGPRILTFDAKWSPDHPAYRASLPVCPAQVPPATLQQLEGLALAAYQAVGAPPYARVDLRCDEPGRPYILEVNPNPDLSPEAGLALQAKAAGLSYREVIETIMGLALDSNCVGTANFRPMRSGEAAGLVRITAETGYFRPDEVKVAEEVLTAAQSPEQSDYQVYVACCGNQLLGYVCFGPTPLTHGTWDMYWLAVAPSHQRQGLGRRLMHLAEQQIAGQGGRLIVLETSSQDLYESTRRFHQSLGYRELARVPDFYDVGDAMIIYGKTLDCKEPHRGPP